MSRPIVTFLSDFGSSDPFVGICHGVIVRTCPDATVIHVAHGIEPTSVGEEARIRPGDSVLGFNFRPDRMREITRALADPVRRTGAVHMDAAAQREHPRGVADRVVADGAAPDGRREASRSDGAGDEAERRDHDYAPARTLSQSCRFIWFRMACAPGSASRKVMPKCWKSAVWSSFTRMLR